MEFLINNEGVNMKKVLLSTAIVATLGCTTFAMAGGLDAKTQRAMQKGGAYVGADLGYTDMVLPSSIVVTDPATNISFANQTNDFKHFTVGAHVGYLAQVSEYFLLGAEVGYQYLPNTRYTFDQTSAGVTTNGISVKYSDYLFNLLAVGKYYVNNQFNVFAKAGIAYVNQKITLSQAASPNLVSNPSSEKIKPQIAVGLGYNVTPNVEVTAQYSRVFGDTVEAVSNLNNLKATNIPSSNSYLVGANYYFNS